MAYRNPRLVEQIKSEGDFGSATNGASACPMSRQEPAPIAGAVMAPDRCWRTIADQRRAGGPHKAIALRAMTLLKILSPKRGVGDAPF